MTNISEQVQGGTTPQNGAFTWVHLFPDDHSVPKHIHPAIRRAPAKIRRVSYACGVCRAKKNRCAPLAVPAGNAALNVSILRTVLGPVFPKNGSSESLHSDGSVDSTESIQGLRHFINVRKMALGTDQVEQDIVVELSHRKDTRLYDCCTLDIISSDRFIVSTNSGLFVFHTPNFESSHLAIQSIMPVWEYRFNKKNTILTPLVKVICGSTPQTHLDRRVVVWTGRKIKTLTLRNGLDEYYLDSYTHKDIRASSFGEADLSSGRLFWIGQKRKTILTSSLLFRESCDDRFMRLGNTPMQPKHIGGAMKPIVLEETMTSSFSPCDDVPKLDVYKTWVEFMSWDEESGRLCVLLGSEAARTVREDCPKEIAVIDFV